MNYDSEEEGEELLTKRMKTRDSQWSVIIDFMEKHPQLATHSFDSLSSNEKLKELWKTFQIF